MNMYLVMGMAAAFGSVFLSASLGSLLTGKYSRIGIGLFASIIYGLILWYLYWAVAVGIYGPTPFLFSVIIGSIIGSVISLTEKSPLGWVPGCVIAGAYLIYAIIIVISAQSDMMNAKEKAKLVGDVEVVADLNNVIIPADTTHINLVSEGMAKEKAQNALSKFKTADGAVPGSRYEIGKPTKQYVDGQLWWIFPIEFQGWLKWKQFKEVPGFLRVSAENPFDEGQAVQTSKNGEKINIKHLNSAYFENYAERYLRMNGYLYQILTDWTFEVDDNWRPYYTVSIVERMFGYSGYKTVGIILFDLQTGTHKVHTLNELPSWIDRAVPLDIIDYNVVKWGLYSIEGWWYTLWHDDKSQEPTPGWFLTYSPDGAAQWFSGFTSTNKKDRALTGFATINSRNGKMRFFKATGVTEDVAYQTASSLWSHMKYSPSELTPYNIYGNLTYVIPMDYGGQFKGVSLVSMQNYNINGKGENFEEALRNYRASITHSGAGKIAPSGGDQKILKVTGKIARVGIPINEGNKQIFIFTLEGVERIFQAVPTSTSPKVPLLQKDDEVVISYQETNEHVVTVLTFDIPAVKISE